MVRPASKERNSAMTKHQPPTYRLEVYHDGCDEALDIFRNGRKRPLAKLRYWTAEGLAAELADVLPAHPGLLAEAKVLIADLQECAASDDPKLRWLAIKYAETLNGLIAAVAEAERGAA
jgi:hypothetical protein